METTNRIRHIATVIAVAASLFAAPALGGNPELTVPVEYLDLASRVELSLFIPDEEAVDQTYRLRIHIPPEVPDPHAISPGDEVEGLWLCLEAPGSIMIAAEDHITHFSGTPELYYRKTEGLTSAVKTYATAYGDLYTPPLPSGSPSDFQKLADMGKFLIGLNATAGPFLGFLQLGSRYITYPFDWDLTWNYPARSSFDADSGWSTYMGVHYGSDISKSPQYDFINDTTYDFKTVAWDYLHAGYDQGYDINFLFDLVRESTDATELMIRTVLPFSYWYGLPQLSGGTVRHVEIEWRVKLPGSAADEPDEPPTAPPVTDIRINGKERATIPRGAYVVLSSSLDAGDYAGHPVDHWIYYSEPDGTGHWCRPDDSCVKSAIPVAAAQTTLQTLEESEQMIRQPFTTEGEYAYCMGVDLVQDGYLTMDRFHRDCVTLVVSDLTPPSVGTTVNGSQGPVEIGPGDNFTLSVFAGGGGFDTTPANWGLYCITPDGSFLNYEWYYENEFDILPKNRWVTAQSPAPYFSAPLPISDFAGTTDISTLPENLSAGTYTFCSVLDLVGNDELVVNPLFQECVELTISEVALPVAGIKVNGVDDGLIVSRGGAVSLDLSLDPGIHEGTDADYWLACVDPLGQASWLTTNGTWIADNLAPRPALGDELAVLPPEFQAVDLGTGLSDGKHNCCFGVDLVMDGKITPDHLYADCATFTIEPVVRFTGTITGNPDFGDATGVDGVNVQVESIIEGTLPIEGNPVWTVTWNVYPPFDEMDLRVGDRVEVYGIYGPAEDAPEWWSNLGERIVSLEEETHHALVIKDLVCGSIPSALSFSFVAIDGCDGITYEILFETHPDLYNRLSAYAGKSVRLSSARITRSMGDTSAVVHAFQGVEEIPGCGECGKLPSSNGIDYVSSGDQSRSFWNGAGGTACCGCAIEHSGTFPGDFPLTEIQSATFYLTGSRSNSHFETVTSGPTTLRFQVDGAESIASSREVPVGTPLPDGLFVPWFVRFEFNPPADVVPGSGKWLLTDGDDNIYSAVLLHMSDTGEGGGLPGNLHQNGCQYTEEMDTWYSVTLE